jgi:hypothetical protein
MVTATLGRKERGISLSSVAAPPSVLIARVFAAVAARLALSLDMQFMGDGLRRE